MTKVSKATLSGSGLSMYSLAFCLLFPNQAVADKSANAPSIDILYGAYEVVGRLPGDASQPYRGWIRLAVEEKKLSIDRCIGGQHSEGEGVLSSASPGSKDLPAIKMNYTHNGHSLDATCAYQNDFDNLPRFSCHTSFRDNADNDVPGLESAYPIVWPVPLDYFNCF